ncbi:MAG: DUF488 domain-containing protein [Hyphomonadaceae bacterium]|nr:DUF488 domain-containing protein [Hyphomonadaceae bacterium]
MGRVPAANIRIKRIYEPPAPTDGRRLLVDRLWPRGVSKQAAAVDDWLKDIAPSAELRTWFAHDPARWEGFQKRYADELRARPQALAELRRLARERPVTLLYGAHDSVHNNAAALRRILLGR